MQPPRLYDPAANRGISDVPNRNVSSRVHYVLIMIPRTIVYRKYFFPNHTQKHVLIVAAVGQGGTNRDYWCISRAGSIRKFIFRKLLLTRRKNNPIMQVCNAAAVSTFRFAPQNGA